MLISNYLVLSFIGYPSAYYESRGDPLYVLAAGDRIDGVEIPALF